MTAADLAARAKKRVGTTLKGKYRLDAVLGVGGMAAVYRATHRNGNRVAIKILHLEFSLDEEMRTRFVREGYMANGVDHPGVVKVIDDELAEDGSVFVVMELLEGETVQHLWETHGYKVPVADVVRIARDVLDVLAAAHVRTIVHRDLKPENLFITKNGALKVLDFGIARWRDETSSVTQSGLALGTPAFMSPEQALGKRDQIDGKSDLWSLGATMFSLLTGRYVHEGDTFQEIAVKAATRAAPLIRSVNPDVPAPIAAVIDRALKMDRRVRFPNAVEMKKALHEAWTQCAQPNAPLAAGVTATPQMAPTAALDSPVDPFSVADDDAETRELARAKTPPPIAPSPAIASTTRGVASAVLPLRSTKMKWIVPLGVGAALVAGFIVARPWSSSPPSTKPAGTTTHAPAPIDEQPKAESTQPATKPIVAPTELAPPTPTTTTSAPTLAPAIAPTPSIVSPKPTATTTATKEKPKSKSKPTTSPTSNDDPFHP